MSEQRLLTYAPRFRALAQRLWVAGFSPSPVQLTDDDEDEEDEAPSICLDCAREQLFTEARRLRALVRSWRIPKRKVAWSEFRGHTWGVDVMYVPVDLDTALILWGIEDKILGLTSG